MTALSWYDKVKPSNPMSHYVKVCLLFFMVVLLVVSVFWRIDNRLSFLENELVRSQAGLAAMTQEKIGGALPFLSRQRPTI